MEHLRGRLYLGGAFALAGTSAVAGFLLSKKLPGFTITFLSMCIVLLGLLPFYGTRTLRAVRGLTRHNWRMLFSQAVLGIFLFRMFLLFGVRLTSTAQAGMLTGTTPAITAVMAHFILKERISGRMALGIAATVAGIFLLQKQGAFSLQTYGSPVWGSVLILCAAASEAAFNILSRHDLAGSTTAAEALHPMVQTLLVSAIALVLSVLPALLEQPMAAIRALNVSEWLALLWYGLIVTALAFSFFYAGVKRCGAYTVAAFSGVMPLTAVLLSTLLLGEAVSLPQWIGGGLILLSMWLIG